MLLLRSNLRPRGAPCGWPDVLNWWRPQVPNVGFPACPTMLDLSVRDTDGLITPYAGGLALDLWGQTRVGENCASNPYVSGPFNTVRYVDVWRALSDGVWTSSMVITIRVAGFGTVGGGTALIRAQPYGFTPVNPAAQTRSFVPPPAQSGCAAHLAVATLTLWDTGVFSLA